MQNGWSLLEIYLEKTSLDSVFAQLSNKTKGNQESSNYLNTP